MHVESYRPETHEPFLQAMHEQWGLVFDRELLSDTGFVARGKGGQPLAAVFLYRDPSCRVVFVDNVLTERVNHASNAFRMMGAFRALWQAVAEVCKGAVVVVQTASPFVMATLRRDKWTGIPVTAYRATHPFFEKGA